ncbi:MAG: hypothetical protein ACI8QC_000349 [Planctomycetota bacterium]|jgi:hypothetical protein
MNEHVIRPAIGYGNLVLGVDRAVVRARFGDPNSVKVDDWGDGVVQERWCYRSHQIELDFDSDDEGRLSGINVFSPLAHIGGRELIGMQEPVFLDGFRRAGIDDIILEDDMEGTDCRQYSSERWNLSCWVTMGELESITVWPLYDETGDIPQWPSSGG